MKFSKTIRQVLARDTDNLKLRGSINAVIAANVSEQDGRQAASSTQHVVHESKLTARTDRPEGQEEPDG